MRIGNSTAEVADIRQPKLVQKIGGSGPGITDVEVLLCVRESPVRPRDISATDEAFDIAARRPIIAARDLMRHEVVIELRDVLVRVIRMRLRAFKEVTLAVRQRNPSRFENVLHGRIEATRGNHIAWKRGIRQRIANCDELSSAVEGLGKVTDALEGRWVRLRCSSDRLGVVAIPNSFQKRRAYP